MSKIKECLDALTELKDADPELFDELFWSGDLIEDPIEIARYGRRKGKMRPECDIDQEGYYGED